MAHLNGLHSVISHKIKEIFTLIRDLTQHIKDYISKHVSAIHSGLNGKHVVLIQDSIIDTENAFIYIYKNVTVRLCVVSSKSQSSESRAPMALQFGHNVAGEYAHV
jgi:hypothetical protein